MEKGRSREIIERLIEIIENGQSMPLSAGKVVISRDEAVTLLKELENIIDGELKMYREFNDRRGRIISEAKKEAGDIIYDAEQTASRIRVTKRIHTGDSIFRPGALPEEEKEAVRTASDIYAASLIYTDEMLTEVNDVVEQAYDLVNRQYGKMVELLDEKSRIIARNKAELMESLKELSKEERYSQILELGQLLSYELYSERMKAKGQENTEEIKKVAHIDEFDSGDTQSFEGE